jgi:formylglycine-generating enzyme required for sulfatase activity
MRIAMEAKMRSTIKVEDDGHPMKKRKSGWVIKLMAVGVALASVSLVAKADTNDPKAATKENPYVNSLGMKFVPVPGTNVLFCTTEVTVDQWKAMGRGYQAPSFPQTGNHPAVNVSWNDAKAYCEWLSKTQGVKYRLPTDHEWSCAVGIGHLENPKARPESKSMKIEDVFPWGRQGRGAPPPKGAGNYAGQEIKSLSPEMAEKILYKGFSLISGYNDGHPFTAPVGSYTPNNLGIYDLGGNVWEWCEDKYRSGETWRVLRGGSWDYGDRDVLLSSSRFGDVPDGRGITGGFRVVVAVGSGR